MKSKLVDGKRHKMNPKELDAISVKEAEWASGAAARLQESNRQACKAFILSKYPETIQRSAALGVYAPKILRAMSDHISRIIDEENRVFALVEAAETPEELAATEGPNWPEE